MVSAADEGYGIEGSFALFVILGSIMMTVTTVFGFRLINKVALVTVPFLAAILIAIAVAATARNGVVFDPPEIPMEAMTFGIALSSLIGADMLTITAMPDLSRYTRTKVGAIWSMVVSFPVFAPIVMTTAALAALAMNESNIMALIVELGLGLPALLLLVISAWTINTLNLYSASLSLAATFPKIGRSVYVVIGGVIGCGFALLGIIEAFIPFLVLLGLLIPPIAAIYVIDSYTRFRNRDPAETITNIPAFHWRAVGTWLAAVAIALTAHYSGVSVTSVPALDATIGAALAYIVVLHMTNR